MSRKCIIDNVDCKHEIEKERERGQIIHFCNLPEDKKCPLLDVYINKS